MVLSTCIEKNNNYRCSCIVFFHWKGQYTPQGYVPLRRVFLINKGFYLQKYVEMPETRYKPKLVLKTPSMRAMKNYYDLNIDEGNHMQNDNLSFVADSENGEIRYDRPYSVGSGYLNDSLQFSEVKVGTLSTGTTISGSEFNSDKNEMGSTMKLVTPKIDIVSIHLTRWTFHGLKRSACLITSENSVDYIMKLDKYQFPMYSLLLNYLTSIIEI